ncbi:MAG: hypothetical protein ACLGHV_11450 [Gammaproteobacteria bacterium]
MSALDADALATLTPEEREAIEGSDIRDDDLDAMKKIASKSDASDDDDGDQDDANDGDDDAAPIEGKTAPAEAAAEDAAEDEAPARQAVPRYEAQLPSDYDDQIKTLKDRDAELRQKFKDGEIDIDERDAGLAELSEQREKLLVLRAKAEISQEMTEQTAQSQWQTEINKAISRAAKEDGIDYRKDQAKAADWDQFVRILAANPAHADKSMDWFLGEAHKRVMALHGVAQAPKRDTIDEAKAKRKPPVDAAPKTLAQVPGSDGPGDVASEFADIDALDGWDLEQAIARMSPAQRAKYLKG